MYTINKTYEFTQEIKKSTFICTLIPVNSIEDINEQLKQIRKKYYDAFDEYSSLNTRLLPFVIEDISPCP